MGNRKAKGTYLESLGKAIAIAATLLGIAGGVLAIYDRAKRPELELELMLPYTGWEVMVRNTGAALAKEITVGVVAWRNQGDAPAADVRKSYSVHDLAPGADSALRIEVIADWDDPQYQAYRAGLSTSGYIVAACDGCSEPKAWAFYVPGNNDVAKDRRYFWSRGHSWPIARFKYPNKAPKLYDCVDFPGGVCSDEHNLVWDAKHGSKNKNGITPRPPDVSK
jgi:hypothetical protein